MAIFLKSSRDSEFSTPRTTDDKFLVEIEITNNEEEVKKILKETGVSEINQKDEEI